MKKEIIVSIGYSIFMLIVIGFSTLVVMIYCLLMGVKLEYISLILATGVSIFLLFVFNTFGLLKRKNGRKGYFITMAVLFLCAGGYLAKDLYHESIDIVSAEVNLEQYQPNVKGTKAATLEKKASLQLPNENILKLDGATALYPLYAAFAQATFPIKEYTFQGQTVMSTKTDVAYNNLIKGTVDIIFVASPSEAQLKYAKNAGVTLNMTPIGKEAFVYFVHTKNSIKGLTSDQIRDIYSGEVTNWKDVGGKNDAIRAFQRPADSGSQTAAEKFMGLQVMMEAPTENIISGMGGVIREVTEYKNYRNAIGYTFRFYSTEMVSNDDIRLLEIDGVYPDKESIRSGTYPITTEFYAITAGTDNPHAQEFIDWILSEEGQELVEKTGYVPIN